MPETSRYHYRITKRLPSRRKPRARRPPRHSRIARYSRTVSSKVAAASARVPRRRCDEWLLSERSSRHTQVRAEFAPNSPPNAEQNLLDRTNAWVLAEQVGPRTRRPNSFPRQLTAPTRAR